MSPFTLPLLGPLPWIDVFLIGWFLLTAASVLYVGWDTYRNPEPWVMKLGWFLVTLYMGPVALLLYVLADWEARVPGKWLLHCHIAHHTTHDNGEEHGGGGLTMIINVTL